MKRSVVCPALFFLVCLATGCTHQRQLAGDRTQFAEQAAEKPFAGHIYYLDSAGYFDFIKNEKPENLRSLIYGFFYADTILKRPDLLSQEVPTCLNLMLAEMKETTAPQAQASRNSEVNNWLLGSHLRRLSDNNGYNDEPAGNHGTAVLLFSITLGRRFDTFYRQAIEISKAAGWNIVILSLDPLYFHYEK